MQENVNSTNQRRPKKILDMKGLATKDKNKADKAKKPFKLKSNKPLFVS